MTIADTVIESQTLATWQCLVSLSSNGLEKTTTVFEKSPLQILEKTGLLSNSTVAA